MKRNSVENTVEFNNNQKKQKTNEQVIESNIKIELFIPFVNRKKESKLIGQLLLDQKSNENNPILPILTQQFGSGKTSIVENFRTIIQKENITLNGNIDMLMKATLITINSFTTIVSSISKLISLLFKTIRIAIKNEISNNYSIDETLKQKSIQFANLESTIDTIDSIERAKKGLFHFFKEWSCNSLAPLIIFFDDEMSLSESELVEFWNYFNPLFNHSICNNVFFITAGKSIHLTKFGKGIIIDTSIDSKEIILNMLDSNDIQEMIEKTTYCSSNIDITMKMLLQKYQVDDFEYFAKNLFECSRGIPRIVIKVFEILIHHFTCGHELKLDNKEAISKLCPYWKTQQQIELLNNSLQ